MEEDHGVSMKKPNIFSIATSELSQDAFFAWLVAWADHRNSDHPLQQIGAAFVHFLINKQMQYSKEIINISSGRQWNGIDVWAKVNREILIVIEDKRNASEHSDQLIRYKAFSDKWCQEHGFIPVYLFIKTFSQSKSANYEVEKKSFSVIDREALLRFFADQNIDHPILQEYVEFLELLQNEEESFRTRPYSEWTYENWMGFYRYLDKVMDIVDWKYVPLGDFLGAWWHFFAWKEYDVYLQIEQGNLCVKIGDVLEDQSAVRNEWYEIVISRAKQEGYREIKKPSRFGTGNCMTVAIVELKDWLGADDKIIDIKSVVDRLKRYQDFLERCLK